MQNNHKKSRPPSACNRINRFILLTILCAALTLGLPAPCCQSLTMTAHAEDPGLWYIDEFGVAEAHKDGIDGTGIKVADIDTMLNPDLPWLVDANVIIRDKNITKFYGDVSPITDNFERAYHATDMLSLLQSNGQGATGGSAPVGIIPGATIYHYAAVHSEDDSITGGDIYDEAVRLALEDDVDLIIIPAGGLSFYDRQYPYLLEAIKRGIPVLVAHSNERVRIAEKLHPEYYSDASSAALSEDQFVTSDPEDEICYWPGLVTVQCINRDRQLQILSDVEDPGTDIASPGENIWMQFYNWGNFEPSGGGCSAAATVAGGYLTLAMQKWPDATGNQILQLLVATANPDAGKIENGTHPAEGPVSTAGLSVTDDGLSLARDSKYGFGVIDLQKMLETDPTDFPDVNPILYTDIFKTVKNAEARGVSDKLTENVSLMEIAGVLDEQLLNAELDRPDFLITLLGDRPVPEDTSSDEASDTLASAEGSATASVSVSISEDSASQTTASSSDTDSSLPVATIALCIALGVGLILLVTVIIHHKKENVPKDTDSSPHG